MFHHRTIACVSHMKFLFCCIFSFLALPIVASPPNDGTQKFKGYPLKGENIDVLPGFIHPSKGYGNIPFYWWNGDSLNRDRLREQLDILAASATDGFTISYIHLHNKSDSVEMQSGYGLFGRTEPGRPKIFTEEWWDFWSWYSEECAARGIGLGLDDYTVGWSGNGYYPDELKEMPKFKNYQGELMYEVETISKNGLFTRVVPKNTVTVVAYNTTSQQPIDLMPYISSENRLSWQAPSDSDYKIFTITAKEGYLIHPDHGKELIGVYFDRFEKRMGNAAEKGMNYFFQDELYYPLKFGTWAEDFREQFQTRKGYDIAPYLPALFENIGEITPKIRLDYCEVVMDLAEERYFRPIYEWNAERGLIYAADNLSRGTDPLAYLDYFRANSWYTAPGNDAPSKGSSFLQTKISSSITHLYERQRTWLEAFHSMGWGSSGSWLTQQMDHHFMAGGNLVCMHGLYYSTHGGWWEWAPPCFHFRMPYWPHVKKWLEYTERLSYLMSQGTHVCDIALMYPTEYMQAYPGTTTKPVFDLALTLSNSGLDYDFMEYQSLRKAVAGNGVLSVSGEKYRVLILSGMKAMHHSSLLKALEHYRNGGIVMATDALPLATTKSGENDDETNAILRELFGLTSVELAAGKKAIRQTNAAGGVGIYLDAHEVVPQILSLITPDFRPEGGKGKVLHRRAGKRDIYMVMDVPRDSECFFRTTGKVELWDAANGSVVEYPVIRQTEEGTWLKVRKEPTNSYLFVFSPGTPTMESSQHKTQRLIAQTMLDDDWEVELLPTMNNKWGDFRFPAFDGLIGAEARSFRHSPAGLAGKDWMQPAFDDSQWTESVYGFGPQMQYVPVPSTEPLEKSIALLKDKRDNHLQEKSLLEFSWQYGVYDHPGTQGWHGLKGKVSDGFLILDRGVHQLYATQVYAPANGMYRLETAGVAPKHILLNGQQPSERVYLKKGWHQLIVAYPNTKKDPFRMTTGAYHDPRLRSAVVLFPESSPVPENLSLYAQVISMRWGLGDHLMYDPYGGKHKTWNYRFRSAPGLSEMVITVAGKNLKVWFDGKTLQQKNIRLLESKPGEINTYQVTFDYVREKPGLVAFSVHRETGYQGAAVVCEPVLLKTEKGLLPTGNWSETGALQHYSGGMYYRKQITMQPLKDGEKAIIDLGDVVASCELKVNGQPAGILMSPPYTIDISNYVKAGTNDIEVLVYSTLSNHYQTIPTPYRGDGVAGLIGPVKLEVVRVE